MSLTYEPSSEPLHIGMRTPEAKALIARFLALPQVPISI